MLSGLSSSVREIYEEMISKIGKIYEEHGLIYYGEMEGQPVWKGENGYYRIDRMKIDGKHFIILEWSDALEVPFEDSEVFLYDISDDELKYHVLSMF